MKGDWTVTVRVRGKVSRRRVPTLGAALEAAQGAAEQASAGPRAETVDLRVRSYEPERQVVSRMEVSGPGRFLPAAHGGIDVLGDGSTRAWTGRVRRALVEPRGGETPAQALARVMAQSTRVEP